MPGRLRIASALLFAVHLSAQGLAAQGATDPRRALDQALAARDADGAERALEALRAAPDIPTFQHALKSFEARFDDLSSLRLKFLEQSDLLAKNRQAIADQRARASQHGASVDKAIAALEAEAQKITAERQKLSAALEAEGKLRAVLRRGLGRLMSALDEIGQREIARRLKNRWRSAKVPEDRRELLGLLVWNDDPEAKDLLLRVFEIGEISDKVAACVVLGERGGERAVEPALRGLVDPSWTVRIAAIELLGKLGGRSAVLALIERLPLEEGRQRSELVKALETITGANFHTNVHLWREWFAANEANLGTARDLGPQHPTASGGKPAPKKPTDAARGRGFYGLETDTKHPIYVIDFSGSMAEKAGGAARKPDEPLDYAQVDLRGNRRVDAVARELLRSVESLPSDGTFNVILFSTGAEVWRNSMQPSNQANREALREWLLALRPGGSTNLFGGLEQAFRIAGRGSFDKSYELAADTIYLLSDGSPSAGRIVQTAEILREIRTLNELRRVAVHAIGFGSDSRFLRELARQNHGDYVFVP